MHGTHEATCASHQSTRPAVQTYLVCLVDGLGQVLWMGTPAEQQRLHGQQIQMYQATAGH